eukprot:gene24680-30034_t
MAAMKATHSMTRTQRVEKEYAAMTSALVKHVPSANAPVNTFAIAYAVIPLSYPDYPIGADGHPLRLGLKTDLHIDRVYDQYGLPRCCMTHRIDPAKWKGEVVDLASEEESEPDETAEDDNSSNRRIRYSSPDLPYSSPTGGDCRSYMARNLAHHQPLPASFRRLVNSLEANSTTPVTDVARVVQPKYCMVSGRRNDLVVAGRKPCLYMPYDHQRKTYNLIVINTIKVVHVGASTLVTMMALVERKEQMAWMTLYVLASSTMITNGIPSAITSSDI